MSETTQAAEPAGPQVDMARLLAADEAGIRLEIVGKDIIVFDPRTLLVLHVQRDGTRRLAAPVEIDLECGCRCRV